MGLVYNPVTGELDEVADDEIDVSNYDYGTTPNLTDAEVEAELDRFREEYKDEIPNMAGFEKEVGAANVKTVTDFLGKYGKQALSLFKKPGSDEIDFTKLLTLAGGAYAASRPSGSTPTGYQGKIPKLTATSNMLTAPPVGRRPGSGGINYGGGTTYRDEKGNVVSSNEKTLEELLKAAKENPFNRPSTYENPSYGRPPVNPTPGGGGLPDIAPTPTPTPAPTPGGGGLPVIAPPAPSTGGYTPPPPKKDTSGFVTGAGDTGERFDPFKPSLPPGTTMAMDPTTRVGNTVTTNGVTRPYDPLSGTMFTNAERLARAEKEILDRQTRRDNLRNANPNQEVFVANPSAPINVDTTPSGFVAPLYNPAILPPKDQPFVNPYAASLANRSTIPLMSGESEDQGAARLQAQANELDARRARVAAMRASMSNGGTVGMAAGGLAPKGFVVPADVVSHLGNGSSEAGLKLLVANLGAEPIKGEGDGMSDSIPTTIGGKQEARVANDEAFISPEMVKKIGGGSAEKGAKKLYAMMDRVREERTGTTEQGKQIDPNKFMPGGSVKKYQTGGTTTKTVPAGATGSESSLSNWAGDYVTNMLGQGAAQANKPYEAYTGPLTAGASGLQQQAFGMAGNLQTPGSIGQAAGTAGGIANLAANMRYTPQTTNFLGQPNVSGLGMTPPAGGDVQGRSIGSPRPGPDADGGMISEDSWMMPGESPDRFAVDGGMTGGVMRPPKPDYSTMPVPEGGLMARGAQQGSDIAQQYMNPYLESALRPQMAEMQRVADIARVQDAGRLTQAGAYGGSRQAIMESEGRRNLLGKQSEALGQGYATAYDKAMAQFNSDQTRRAQEAQFGATFGLDSLKTGIQGAQTQAQAGALQSTAEQAGLRGLLDAGAVERGIESEGIAADKAQFEEARLNPFKMVQFQQSLLSGMPLASQSYSMPGQSNLQQFAGGAKTLQELIDILSGKKSAATKN
jgi:hypothetical protein